LVRSGSSISKLADYFYEIQSDLLELKIVTI
jgi:hypothetical protein